MSMTRKDFERIAAAIKDSRPDPKDWRATPDSETIYYVKQSTINLVQNLIAAALSSDNPRFDRERFAEACGDNWAVQSSYPYPDSAKLSVLAPKLLSALQYCHDSGFLRTHPDDTEHDRDRKQEALDVLAEL